MLKKTGVAILMIGQFLSLFAQEASPGIQDYHRLASPYLLGSGATVTSPMGIQGDILNPSLSADVQRLTLDLNYLGLYTNSDPGEIGGHSFNFGLSLPQRYGVWTGSFHFLNSSAPGYNYGTKLGLNVSLAKDLFPDFFIGAGLGTGLLFRPSEQIDSELTLSLGVFHRIQELGLMKNFQWGLSIRDIGKSILLEEGISNDIAWITPAFGTRFDLLYTDHITLALRGDVYSPLLQDLVLNGGLELTFFQWIHLGLSMETSLKDAASGNGGLLIPTLSLRMDFKTDLEDQSEFLSERGWARSEIRPSIGLGYLRNQNLAYGLGLNIPLGSIDTNPPQIEISYDQPQHISPNNSGINDYFALPVKITDERDVMAYRLEITDSQGNPVRLIENKEDRPETQDLMGLLDRFLAVKKGIQIPEEILWDGRNEEGSVVPDGTYQFTLWAMDDNENEAEIGPFSVVVDLEPPELALGVSSPDQLIFNPSNQAGRSTLTFEMEGSEEELWKLEVFNSLGSAVLTKEFPQQAPQSFQWDGKDNENNILPDGVYWAKMSAQDLAGNETASQIDNIIINTQVTPVTIVLEDGYFSPNGKGVKDQMVLLPQIPVRTGVVSWTLSILDSQNRVRNSFSGDQSNLPTGRFLFDGKEAGGQVLPEGAYRAKLELLYNNGNKPTSLSPEFVLDVTPPEVNLLIEGPAAFSPGGEGPRTEIPFVQRGTEEVQWTGEVFRKESNTPVRKVQWTGQPPARFTWNGVDDQGKLLEDGEYIYRLSSTDRAGNSNSKTSEPFLLDTRDREALLTAQDPAFSPNGDRVQDVMVLVPRANVITGITDYKVDILDWNSNPIRTFSGRGTLAETVSWDGRGTQGGLAPEGDYRGRLTINYANGATVTATSGAFLLDVTFPEAQVVPSYYLFSPNGDEKKDVILFSQSSSVEELWTGEILNSRNQVIRTYTWQKEAKDFSWDGRDENRNILSDGAYTYRLSSTDKAGNKRVIETEPFRIDNRPTSLFLTLGENAFSNNSGAQIRKMSFGLVASLNEGIEEWTLGMIHSKEGKVMEFFGENSLPATIEWDGVGIGGQSIQGEYTALLKVTYRKGDELEQKSASFILDNTPPKVEVSLDPKPFSPDNDSIDDELRIRIAVQNLTEIDRWSFKINDPQGNLFQLFEGRGKPGSSILWDGRSNTGELVQAAVDYPYELVVVDRMGLSTKVTGQIPVDILVIRVGDRYKIAVPSITFKPNSPELIFDNSAEGLKNKQVLRRLSEILQRYNQYKIVIEGHAVSVFWYDAERAAREEEQELGPLSLRRAEKVKEELQKLGVDISRYSTAGRGGTEPVVPHSDEKNRWKNRRVEFILVR